MKRFLKLFAGAVFAGTLLLPDASAAEKDVVQTLTFDSITTRRGIWKFPDNTDQYRKILMYYTLKCDPQTKQDSYNCGEWDYDTYNRLYFNTGEMDSNLVTAKRYRLGRTAPQEIPYTTQPIFNTREKLKIETTINSIDPQNEFSVGDGSESLILEKGTAHQIQFYYTEEELKTAGVRAEAIKLLKLHTGKGKLKNASISIRKYSKESLDELQSSMMILLYEGDIDLANDGWNYVNLQTPFYWTGSTGVVIELKYDSSEEDITFYGNSNTQVLHRDIRNNKMTFDGNNDYIVTDINEELNAVEEFTYETWIRVDEWKNWAKVMGKEIKTIIELGDANGEIYLQVRNGNNEHGYNNSAVMKGVWTHIAMVFNGKGATNQDKLKLYVNGEESPLTYSTDIPSKTIDIDFPYSIAARYTGEDTFDGDLDDVRVWTKAVDGNTIKDWYNKSLDNSHPYYSNLILNYDMESVNDYVIADKSDAGNDGTIIGPASVAPYPYSEIIEQEVKLDVRPAAGFVQGDNDITTKGNIETIQEPVKQISIVEYKAENKKFVIDNIMYVYPADIYTYSYDLDGNKKDSTLVVPENTITNENVSYYTDPFEKIDVWEIGRFITPYGINLDLGPDGFTWIYDVTDYAPLLKGEVDMQAGNQQELIDVRFEFIKGTPPRQVKSIKRPWGTQAQYLYGPLSDDSKLSATDVALNPEASQWKMKTRITGHGHNSNTGDYPHCCEWKENTHYLHSNGNQIAAWKIWRDDCALNPVYPQGGTWPGAREGWCPGDLVREDEFELTQYVSNNNLNIDYSITPLPTNNQGMSDGQYRMAFHVVEYGENSFANDVEIYDVYNPNNWPAFSRMNPICSDPTIVIRNNGSENLTSLKISYNVSGNNNVQTLNWTGNVKPHTKEIISLPVDDASFWIGDEQHKFMVSVAEPNGKQDEYADNDSYETTFELPDFYNKKVIVELKTNARPEHFNYIISDIDGDVLVKRNYNSMKANTYYRDTITVNNACLTLEVNDQAQYGLSYWAYPAQGNGTLSIKSIEGTLLKVFNPDFGAGIHYSFRTGDISYVKEANLQALLQLSPIPAKEEVTLRISEVLGNAKMEISDLNGATMLSESISLDGNFEKTLNLNNFANGTYYIRIESEKVSFTKEFIVNK